MDVHMDTLTFFFTQCDYTTQTTYYASSLNLFHLTMRPGSLSVSFQPYPPLSLAHCAPAALTSLQFLEHTGTLTP